MKFMVQASDPRPSNLVNASDSSLSEAIESIFPLHTEFAIMAWNDIYIPLTYKYDISIIADDILLMLDSLLTSDDGSITIFWPSNTFCAQWSLTWSVADLVITATWESVIGGTEKLLNESPVLNLDKRSFILEWKPLLRKIKDSILAFAGNVDTEHILAGLNSIASKLPIDQKNE